MEESFQVDLYLNEGKQEGAIIRKQGWNLKVFTINVFTCLEFFLFCVINQQFITNPLIIHFFQPCLF